MSYWGTSHAAIQSNPGYFQTGEQIKGGQFLAKISTGKHRSANESSSAALQINSTTVFYAGGYFQVNKHLYMHIYKICRLWYTWDKGLGFVSSISTRPGRPEKLLPNQTFSWHYHYHTAIQLYHITWADLAFIQEERRNQLAIPSSSLQLQQGYGSLDWQALHYTLRY